MKRLFPLLGFIALLGLSSCVERQEISPYYNPETKQVNTQFFLNFEAENSVKTKQLKHDVQADTSFHGLSSATLFAFTLGEDGKYLVLDTIRNHMADAMFNLSNALQAGAVDSTHSRRIIELSIPVGTNSLIFYGKATRGDTEADDEKYGKLSYVQPGDGRIMDLYQIGCYAKPRVDTLTNEGKTKRANFRLMGQAILELLNHLDSVGFNGNSANGDGPWNTRNKLSDISTTYPMTGIRVMWKDYTVAAHADGSKGISPLPKLINPSTTTEIEASPLEQILGNAYNKFATIVGAGTNDSELRAGSGSAIARQLTDLAAVLTAGSSSSALDDAELVAQRVIRLLNSYINSFINTNGTNTWKEYDSEANPPFPVQYAIEYYCGKTMSLPTAYTFTDFPHNFNLPFGSSTLLQATDGNWYYNSEEIPLPEMGGGYMTVYDYTYPPELTYYGNGPIRVRNTNLNEEDFPNGIKNWTDNDQWAAKGWLSQYSHVISSTRGVALAENVQYGVGMLETRVKCAAVLKDNNSGIHTTEHDNEITVDNDHYLELTGVLVGGQPSFVGWDYTYYQDAQALKRIFGDDITNNFKRMIYDMTIQKGVITTAAPTDTANCYTLVLDNYDPDGSQNEVYVSLEFKNHLGTDFWGKHNMVRDEGTFYLIGKLSLASSSGVTPLDMSTTGTMLPYRTVNRVFIQDYTTKALFTIGENALKNAYVTVPDLRAAKLSFGLSVNLEWASGNMFEVNL